MTLEELHRKSTQQIKPMESEP